MKLKVGVFAYDFPHWKTQQGIMNLCANHLKPDVVLAAPFKQLNVQRSKVRILPKDLHLMEPRSLAYNLDIPYYVIEHNSDEAAQVIAEHDLDVGVILGARILKPIVIKPFKIGIINMHPGILPENRGLDNVKWAIFKGLPQGVTTHLIDSKIDRGRLIDRQCVQIYYDDTVMDVAIRVQNLEQKMMLEALNLLIQKKPQGLQELPEGVYHKAFPNDLDIDLDRWFNEYVDAFIED